MSTMKVYKKKLNSTTAVHTFMYVVLSTPDQH